MKRTLSRFLCVIVSIVMSLSVLTACSKQSGNKQTDTKSEQTAELDPIQSLSESEKMVYDLLLSRIKSDFKVPQSVRIIDIKEPVDPDHYTSGETPLKDWGLGGAKFYFCLSATNDFGGTVTEICELSFVESQSGYLKLCEEPKGATFISINHSEERIAHINAALNYYWKSIGL